MKIKIEYNQEVLIIKEPVGTVFASGQCLWVKIDDYTCMVLGTGEFVSYTSHCKAKKVTSLLGTT